MNVIAEELTQLSENIDQLLESTVKFPDGSDGKFNKAQILDYVDYLLYYSNRVISVSKSSPSVTSTFKLFKSNLLLIKSKLNKLKSNSTSGGKVISLGLSNISSLSLNVLIPKDDATEKLTLKITEPKKLFEQMQIDTQALDNSNFYYEVVFFNKFMEAATKKKFLTEVALTLAIGAGTLLVAVALARWFYMDVWHSEYLAKFRSGFSTTPSKFAKLGLIKENIHSKGISKIENKSKKFAEKASKQSDIISLV